MKRPITFSVSVSAPVLLSSATAAAQSRPGELGRGFPYSSGGELSWGPLIAVLVLVLTLGIAGMVKEQLDDQPWWHTLIVVVATLLSSIALSVQFSPRYPVGIGLILFMLIPSFAGVGLLYLTVMGLVQGKGSR